MPAAELTVIADGKAVRLLLDPSDQGKHRRIPLNPDFLPQR